MSGPQLLKSRAPCGEPARGKDSPETVPLSPRIAAVLPHSFFYTQVERKEGVFGGSSGKRSHVGVT